MAPRGVVAAAVTAVFALRLEQEGFAGAERLVPIVFFVIVGTVAIYGLLDRPLAIRLGIAERDPNGVVIVAAHPFARGLARALRDLDLPVLVVDTNPGLISDARMEGLRVYHGSVVSDKADDELDLPGIGKIFAMTPNDEVNALSARHFVHLFGRENLFHLAQAREPEEGSAELSAEVRARVLFGEDATYREMESRWEDGTEYKATPLTEQFRFADWRREYGDEALPLLTVSSSGVVKVATVDQPLDPKPGDTLLGFMKVE